MNMAAVVVTVVTLLADVCDACIYGIVLHVFACVPVSFDLQIMHVLTRLLSHRHVHALRDQAPALMARMCLYLPVADSHWG